MRRAGCCVLGSRGSTATSASALLGAATPHQCHKLRSGPCRFLLLCGPVSLLGAAAAAAAASSFALLPSRRGLSPSGGMRVLVVLRLLHMNRVVLGKSGLAHERVDLVIKPLACCYARCITRILCIFYFLELLQQAEELRLLLLFLEHLTNCLVGSMVACRAHCLCFGVGTRRSRRRLLVLLAVREVSTRQQAERPNNDAQGPHADGWRRCAGLGGHTRTEQCAWRTSCYAHPRRDRSCEHC